MSATTSPGTGADPSSTDAGQPGPRPHFIPRMPPPKAIRRYSDKDLPPVGAWVSVTWKKETVTGRVMISEPERIRIRDGAGFWEIPLREVSKIVAAPDPRDRKKDLHQPGNGQRQVTIVEIDD